MFNARVLCLLYLVITPILIYKIIDHYESALKNEKQTFVFTLHSSVNGILFGWKQNDPSLIELIQSYFLIKPPLQQYVHNPEEPYPEGDVTQWGQQELLRKLFKGKRNGYFIEAGAADGIQFSNTLDLELRFNWTGLLVEPTKEFFAQLRSNKRNAYLLNNCLAEERETKMVNLINHGLLSGINPTHTTFLKRKEKWFYSLTVCLPITSILRALAYPTVHFFSLDIEGAEGNVLETIEWQDVDIHVWLIEHGGDAKRKESIRSKMKNYSMVAETKEKRDFVFVRKDVLHLYDINSLDYLH